MGCGASTSSSQQVYIPRSLKIITESGKTFVLGYNDSMKVSDIKQLMEMRIGARSETLRLFLRRIHPATSTNYERSKERSSDRNSSSSPILSHRSDQQNVVNDNDNGGPNDNHLAHQGESGEEIELEDAQFISKLRELLEKYEKIYLHQEFPNSPQQQKQVNRINKPHGTQQNYNQVEEQWAFHRNQSICLGTMRSEYAIAEVINKIENGEFVSHSQIEKIQFGQAGQLNPEDINCQQSFALNNSQALQACDLSVRESSPKRELKLSITSH